jgi:hypothetical protein
LSLIRANSLCELILSASHRRHADFREFTNQIAKELVTAVITCDFRSLAITPATEDIISIGRRLSTDQGKFFAQIRNNSARKS